MKIQYSNPVRDYFTIDTDNKQGICDIDTCKTIIKGNHASNFERHLESYHPDHFKLHQTNKKKSRSNDLEISLNNDDSIQPKIYDNIDFKRKMVKVSVQISDDILKSACAEMVTKNGLPLSVINCSGFRKILDPILKSLKSNLTINTNNTKKFIDLIACDIKESIKIQVKDQLISFKLDIANRLDRHILGNLYLIILRYKYTVYCQR